MAQRPEPPQPLVAEVEQPRDARALLLPRAEQWALLVSQPQASRLQDAVLELAEPVPQLAPEEPQAQPVSRQWAQPEASAQPAAQLDAEVVEAQPLPSSA